MTANAIMVESVPSPLPAPLSAPLAAPLPAPLRARLQQFPLRRVATPLRRVATPLGRMACRHSGAAAQATHVLLHVIGSSSANRLAQVEAAADDPAFCLLAWDAPGYGSSDALPMPAPTAADYAQRLWAWLDAVEALSMQGATSGAASHAAIASASVSASATVAARLTLLGHSLGCLMAASAAVQSPQRVKRLILLAPAQGYARAPAAQRDKKLQDSLDSLDSLARLGPAGMAHARGATRLSPSARAGQVAFVQQAMAQINPAGYAQAARMLAGGDLVSDLGHFAVQTAPSACPVWVASGSADTITPPEGCQQVAGHIHAPDVSLAAVGHACAVEAADDVTRLLGLAGPAAVSLASAAPSAMATTKVAS